MASGRPEIYREGIPLSKPIWWAEDQGRLSRRATCRRDPGFYFSMTWIGFEGFPAGLAAAPR